MNASTGYKLVPVEPTEDMIIAGFESVPCAGFSPIEEVDAYEAMSGCQQAAHRARLCYAAMLAAADGAPMALAALDGANFERMFTTACEDLGAISEALGIDSNIEGGANPILDAIDSLRTAAPFPSRFDLEAIGRAMQHMGDELNASDSAGEEDENITLPGFEAIARLLDAAPVAAPAPSKSLNALVADSLRPFCREGRKVIWREPFRWHDDNGVLSNHYDGMELDQLADDFGYEIIHDMRNAAVVAKRVVLFQCALAMICAMWIAYAAEQQAKQADYYQVRK
jgi:hypothetical protein